MADVVEQVRVLIVGTTWPEAAIAARVGVGVATVHAWKTRHGWRRPADASLSTRKVGLERAGFTRRCRAALRRLEAMAERESVRIAETDDSERLSRARTLLGRVRAALRPVRSREAAP
ncbi:terminase gpP N-terminus-related DNA-binding protein [Enterovirga rhinocerotis]|uniref:Putative ATPase subunit gpP of terminase n=1 Tax=Enterovirga rhinocerotis TaxID=1339210 RepID=A0A4R7CCY0_9HYPH|nr:hypothetical protein [Enterovirga rhinocerotis]TDR94677.1 putative ATPase subunit gpP of terminase [Enterovirga rhinocerotis]